MIKLFISLSQFSLKKPSIKGIQSLYGGVCNKKLSTISLDNSSDSDNEIENVIGMEDSVGYQLSISRNDFSHTVTDPLLITLNNCVSVQEVLNFIKINKNSMKPNHINQSMQVLWELQKIYFHMNTSRLDINAANYVHPKKILNNYLTELNSHRDFKELLAVLKTNYEHFNVEELTYTLLCLTKMGVSSNHVVHRLITEKCNEEIVNNANSVSLASLTNYFIAISSERDLNSILSQLRALPILYQKIDSCDNHNDLKLITICLQKIASFVTTDLLQKYKDAAQNILSTANEHNINTIIKTISFLNNHSWYHSCIPAIRNFILLLKDNIYLLNEHDFIALHKVYRNVHEPAVMFNEIQRHAIKLLVESEDSASGTIESTLQLLTCVVLFDTPLQRKHFEKTVKKYIEIPLNIQNFLSLSKIISRLKITDKSITAPFWNNVLRFLCEDAEYRKDFLLPMVCQKYLNHHKGTDRNRSRNAIFETQIIEWIEEEHEAGPVIPAKFAKYAAFVIAFGKSDQSFTFFREKIAQILCQFKASDCFVLLTGLSITRGKQDIEELIYRQIRVLMQTQNDNFIQTVMLLRCNLYLNKLKRGLVENFLLSYKLDERLISSRVIQDMTYILQNSNCLVPNVVEQLTDYVVQNQDYVFATTCEKLLYLTFHLGYRPKNGNAFFTAVSNTILRDQERLSGLALLQSALSLCYFNSLSESIIKQIFCAEFLEKLDRELTSCYSKEIYPKRVRHCLMKLNRAVCFDYPIANVPWFHKKYIEEEIARGRNKPLSRHFIFVEQVLNKILGTECYETNVFTPYGYYIDFAIRLDKNNKPTTSDSTDFYRQLAILLLTSNSYTNIYKSLKGEYQFKKRHLEILGYQVFMIDCKLWDLLHSPQDKITFIQNILISNALQNVDK